MVGKEILSQKNAPEMVSEGGGHKKSMVGLTVPGHFHERSIPQGLARRDGDGSPSTKGGGRKLEREVEVGSKPYQPITVKFSIFFVKFSIFFLESRKGAPPTSPPPPHGVDSD